MLEKIQLFHRDLKTKMAVPYITPFDTSDIQVVPWNSTRDLYWKMWDCRTWSSNHFGLTLPVIFYQCSMIIYYCPCGLVISWVFTSDSVFAGHESVNLYLLNILSSLNDVNISYTTCLVLIQYGFNIILCVFLYLMNQIFAVRIVETPSISHIVM